MPNRILKESICSSASVDKLSWMEEVFFYRLIVNCDDFGRFDARPAILKARLMPLKSITEKQVLDILNKLETAGIALLYEYDGNPYLQLLSWENHQNVRTKRSKYPPHNILHVNELVLFCKQMISDANKCAPNPIQSYPNPILSESVSKSEKTFVVDAGSAQARAGNAESVSDFLDGRNLSIEQYLGFTQETKAELKTLSLDLFGRFTTRQPTPYDETLIFHHCRDSIEEDDGSGKSKWRIEFPEDKIGLLCYAFESAAFAGCSGNWQYIGGVMTNLHARGLKNIDEVEDYDSNRDPKKGRL